MVLFNILKHFKPP